jgi:SAM-dependent methyltransferase
MRKLDDILRNWRVSKAVAQIRPGGRLLDVGCHDGYLVRHVRSLVGWAVGLDPLTQPGRRDGVEFIRDSFPGQLPLREGAFDCITMLAVLEHMADPDRVAAECFRVLRPGGSVILTVPSPLVDHIIWVLQRLRLVDGLCMDEHHGFEVDRTFAIFQRAGFRLQTHEHFQLGLNNLFVFIKPPVFAPVRVQPMLEPAAEREAMVPVLS